jgi:Flp pilus assembly protein CpaB
VLRHVKVLAVDQSFETNLEGAKPSQTVTLEVTPDDALALIKDGTAAGGMAAKLEAGLRAVAHGVTRVRIGDLAALPRTGAGTTLVEAPAVR